MNIKKMSKFLVPIILFININTAYAANSFSCVGKIDKVGIHGTNRVILKLTSMNTVVNICSPEDSRGSVYPVSPEQCKLAYSTLLSAFAMDMEMSVFFDNVATGTNCSNFAPWELATARFVSLDRSKR